MTINYLRILLAGFILAGCTKAANLSVQALSTTLAEMKTTNQSPFDQNFSTNKYAVFSGQCLNIITGLQISFDGGTWLDIPSSAVGPVSGSYSINGISYTYSETSTPTGTYDVNCSDSVFYFWIYEHQFDEMIFNSLGLTPKTGDVSTISIRGVSGSYTTEPTVYTSPYHSGPPTKISLQKATPSAGAVSNQCVELVTTLRASDDRLASSSSNISFSLNHKINSNADSFVLYSNYYDCSNQVTANQISPSSLTIASNQSQLRVYYSVPTATVGDTHWFSITYNNNPVALDTTSAIATFVIKDTSDQYLEVGAPYKVLTNTCYPLDVYLRYYSGSSASSSSDIIEITASSDLEVFSSSSCTTAITNFTLGGSSKRLYVKVKSTATISSGSITIANALFDSGGARIEYDLSGDSTIAHVRVHGSSVVNFGSNSFLGVSRYNKYGTPILATSVTPIPLSLNYPDKGYFCASSVCSSSVNSVSIPAGDYVASIEYQPLLGGTVTISPDVSGVTNYGNTINVIGGITSLAFGSPITSMTSGSCYAVQVQTQDSAGSNLLTSASLAVTISGIVSGEIFSDAGCSVGITGTITVPIATSSATFYWQPLIANGSSRTLQAGVLGLNLASVGVAITP